MANYGKQYIRRLSRMMHSNIPSTEKERAGKCDCILWIVNARVLHFHLASIYNLYEKIYRSFFFDLRVCFTAIYSSTSCSARQGIFFMALCHPQVVVDGRGFVCMKFHGMGLIIRNWMRANSIGRQWNEDDDQDDDEEEVGMGELQSDPVCAHSIHLHF